MPSEAEAMTKMPQGRYRLHYAASDHDLTALLRLRAEVFRGDPHAVDQDRFDSQCTHLWLEDQHQGTLVAGCRFQLFTSGDDLANSYAAQYYDLSPLRGQQGGLLELGRFCVAPGQGHPDILRLIWQELTRVIEAGSVKMLFGCTSFNGIQTAGHRDAFALLAARHLGPNDRRPKPKAAEIVNLTEITGGDLSRGLKGLPPLLRSYLTLGGWVSDHAVLDRDLNTIHVFTALEVAMVPANRAVWLRGDSAR